MDTRVIAVLFVAIMVLSSTNALPKQKGSYKNMNHADFLKGLDRASSKRDCRDSHWSCFFQSNYEDICSTAQAEECALSCGLC
ncbi:protein ShK-like4 [Nematostella vectensis]|nr:protein ShK-like4 [Nematostella vectensis]